MLWMIASVLLLLHFPRTTRWYPRCNVDTVYRVQDRAVQERRETDRAQSAPAQSVYARTPASGLSSL
jgi:hypothetical protein